MRLPQRAARGIAGLRARLAPAPGSNAPAPNDVHALVVRLDELEAMVEGLQDAVDRESRRHDAALEELARRLEPSELARAISDDARKRGL